MSKPRNKKNHCPFQEKGCECYVTFETSYGDKHFCKSEKMENAEMENTNPALCVCWNRDIFTRVDIKGEEKKEK